MTALSASTTARVEAATALFAEHGYFSVTTPRATGLAGAFEIARVRRASLPSLVTAHITAAWREATLRRAT